MLEIKHTSVFDKPAVLEIKPVRYECKRCDDNTTTTEKYDWVATGGKITKGLEEYILRKQHECLTEADKDKLALLIHSPILKKAHSYALDLSAK
jgi:hypothetical protein